MTEIIQFLYFLLFAYVIIDIARTPCPEDLL